MTHIEWEGSSGLGQAGPVFSGKEGEGMEGGTVGRRKGEIMNDTQTAYSVHTTDMN